MNTNDTNAQDMARIQKKPTSLDWPQYCRVLCHRGNMGTVVTASIARDQ